MTQESEFAFELHMKSEMHKNNSRIGDEQAVTLYSFGFVSSWWKWKFCIMWKSCLWKWTP